MKNMKPVDLNEVIKYLKIAQAVNVSDASNSVSQEQFISKYQPDKKWAIGPFKKNDKYTFHKKNQLSDPLNIGWTSSSIFNPTMMVKDEKIFLFYRASVKKESISSRVGMAVYDEKSGWTNMDEPVLYPTLEHETMSIEDPKIYCYGKDKYIMFYNTARPVTEPEAVKYGLTAGDVCVDINYALSSDLYKWEKTANIIVPHEITKLWVKGAVIPRNEHGEAVKINGKYMMFISEGCGGKQVIGYSTDMLNWSFKEETYMYIPKDMGTQIHEVACAIADGNNLIIDVFYGQLDGTYGGAQVLYSFDAPTKQIDITTNATLSWGGIMKYKGEWIFPQGWDAPRNEEVMYFYTCKK